MKNREILILLALGIPTTSQVIAAANNPKINPLQPVGAWFGTTLYDLTHSKANGGSGNGILNGDTCGGFAQCIFGYFL